MASNTVGKRTSLFQVVKEASQNKVIRFALCPVPISGPISLGIHWICGFSSTGSSDHCYSQGWVWSSSPEIWPRVREGWFPTKQMSHLEGDGGWADKANQSLSKFYAGKQQKKKTKFHIIMSVGQVFQYLQTCPVDLLRIIIVNKCLSRCSNHCLRILSGSLLFRRFPVGWIYL